MLSPRATHRTEQRHEAAQRDRRSELSGDGIGGSMDRALTMSLSLSLSLKLAPTP